MADNNILIKIRGEADMTDAQMQLQDMSDKGKQLTREMADLTAAERNMIAQQRQRVDAGKQEDAALTKLIQEQRQLRKECQEQINTNQKSINTLKQAISTYQAQQGAGKRLMMQVRQLREELSKMEMAGDTSSQAFIELSVQAAKLQDQMGDTQKQIAILSSDTANLDATMSLGSGLAGAFTAATSAAALLGGENEALEKSFLQVQAAMAVLNGVQQVANALNKDSAANVVIRTALNKLFNREKAKEAATTVASTAASVADAGAKTAEAAATTAAATATKGLTAAMLANPATAILAAIAALVAGIIYFTEKSKEAAVAQRDFNGQMERYNQLAEDAARSTEFSAALAEAEGKSAMEVLEIRKAAAEEAVEVAKAAYDKMYNDWVASGDELEDEERELLDSMLKNLQDAQDKSLAISSQIRIEQVRETKKAEEEQEQARKEAAQKAADAAKQRAQEIAEAQKQLEDVKLGLMKNSQGKELLQLNLEYKRKIEAIKGHSKTENDLRAALEQERQQKEAEIAKKWEMQRLEESTALSRMELENKMEIAEEGSEQMAEVIQQRYELEVEYAKKTIENERELQATLAQLKAQYDRDITSNAQTGASKRISKTQQEAENKVAAEENAALKILQNEQSTNEERMAARQTLASHSENMRNIEADALKEQFDAGLIAEEEYQAGILDIERAALDEHQALMEQKAAATQEVLNSVLSWAGNMASEIFGAISDSISQQLSDLDEMYTTDAQEAKEDADKKYLSEKELSDKKLALKQKQARIDKAQAAFNIGISTAQAIMQAIAMFGPPPSPMGIAAIAMATVLGATQLAVALSKPLPKYAKGRKGGQGEMALVGEQGPELMYIPAGASIVPNKAINNPGAWLNMPELPNFDSSLALQAASTGTGIDYAKLGKAIADSMPKNKAVTVNVDRNGVTVNNSHSSIHYLNQKYTGSWI